VPDAQPSSARSPGRSGVSRSGALVGLALLAPAALLGPGCLPQEKLSSYSRGGSNESIESSPDAATGESTGLDASGGDTGGDGSSSDTGASNGGELADAGGASDGEPDPTSIDAGPTGSDAGGLPLTTSLPDAGTAALDP
jgi:hypothetical protein